MSRSYRILITDPIDFGAFKKELSKGKTNLELNYKPDISHEELIKIIGNYEGIIFRIRTKLNKELINKSKLLFAGIAGIGLDGIDLASLKYKGIHFVNCPEQSSQTVAEYTIGALISLSRKFILGHNYILGGEWGKDKLNGYDLKGKTLGIIGLGNIGAKIALKVKGFDMNIIANDKYQTEEYAKKVGVPLVELDYLLKNSDFITINVPLTEETKKLIGKEETHKMKKGVFIVNTSREQVVDINALVDAIKSGDIAGYATDVFEEEPPKTSHKLIQLAKQDYNILLTPHIGAQTIEAQRRIAEDIGKKTTNFFDNL